MFQRRSRSLIYQDKWCSFYKDEVVFPGGNTGTHTVLERNSGVAVLIVTPEDHLVLVKQFRYPTQTFEWEFPGGGIDAGENIETAAIREVKEETGLEIKNIQIQATYIPLSSAASEKCTLCIAQVATIELQKNIHPDDEEIAEVIVVPLADALEMVVKGEITDPFTGQAILLYNHIKGSFKK